MATELFSGFKLWPGGSLVSGASVADGAEATGTVDDWAPGYPMTYAQVAAEATLIDLTDGGNCANALQVMGFWGGTASAPITLNVSVWIALLFPLVGATSGNSAYLPFITQLTWAADSGSTRTITSNVGPLPNGQKQLNGATSSITNHFRPLCYPLDNIPRDGANISLAGYARETTVETGSGGNLYGSQFTIPCTGASKAIYVVDSFSPSGGSITTPTLRMLYGLIRHG